MRDTDPTELVRELHDRSLDVGGHPIAFESVRRSARRIQVRRRVAGGFVAAMVLTVAVPAAFAVSDDLTRSDVGPVGPVSPTERVSPTVTRSAAPLPDGPVLLTTKGLPSGGDPRLPYIVTAEQKLVTPDGTFELPADVAMMTPFRDGWLALGSQAGDELAALWLDADLTVTRETPTIGTTLAVSTDHSQVAWTEVEPGTRNVLLLSAPTAGGEPATWPVPSRGEEVVPVGFLGEGRVVFTEGVSSLNGVAEPDGTVTELDGFLHLADAAEATGLVSGLTSFETDAGCSGVMDPVASTTELLWETCDYRLGAFSPDGKRVIGTPQDADGFGPPSLAVLDARSGDVLVELEPERDDPIALYQLAWEDDDSIVAMVYDEGDVLMLRYTLGGVVEQIGRTGVSENMGIPFWFAETSHR